MRSGRGSAHGMLRPARDEAVVCASRAPGCVLAALADGRACFRLRPLVRPAKAMRGQTAPARDLPPPFRVHRRKSAIGNRHRFSLMNGFRSPRCKSGALPLFLGGPSILGVRVRRRSGAASCHRPRGMTARSMTFLKLPDVTGPRIGNETVEGAGADLQGELPQLAREMGEIVDSACDSNGVIYTASWPVVVTTDDISRE